MQRGPGFSAFSIDSLIAPTPGPRLMAGAAAPFMYGGYVLFPGVGGVPLPAPSVTAGLPIDGPSLPLGLLRPGSPSTTGHVGGSTSGTKPSSSASSATGASESVLSAFQSRIQPSVGLLGTIGFSSVTSTATGHRGLKPVPGPHPASSKPIPPAQSGSSSPPTPSTLPGAYPLGLHHPSLTPGGQVPMTSTSPADLTTNSSVYKPSHKGNCQPSLLYSPGVKYLIDNLHLNF